MNTKTTRGFLATAGALLTAAALALSGASAASAATQPAPAESTVTITKLAQPTSAGAPANGTQQTVTGDPIADVTFSYALVTNTAAGGTNDIGTNAGQQWAATQTATTAPTTGVTGTFDATLTNGVTTKVLPRGLYVVSETAAPAGVTPAAPFLLAVPLTDPVDRDKWLNTIYVYPKNAKIGATKTVGAESLIVGGDVTWTITSDIPRISNAAGTAFIAPDAFEIHDTLTDAELTLSTTASPAILVKAGATTLASGTDYNVVPVVATGTTTHQIVFTATGRTALATALNADANAKVTVAIVTTVRKAAVIGNVAKVFPDAQSKTNNKPLTTERVETKYGSYQLNKKSTDTAVTDLSGAQFRVYATQADALAGNANYLKPVNNAGVAQDLWTTDASGHLTVQGLRYSGWVNGTTVASGAAGYQTYYLVEVKALPGHQLLAEPVSFVIDDASVTQTSQLITNQATTGAFVLPLTGGSGVALLTGAGIFLLAAVLLVARLRRRAETAQ
ncbi:SpaH/EbpB family LPXTG-anchored major pilin [uncultured Microbacterium sp.]|uniref:SpaH/EbpB family LPXTG-anchored major pilin n=1 Tax=uncultured Microbacterium sp. TaxID=191216 RepID=UPI002618AF7A|nr:SpaH/EbpB family LPXTG-anchored major pilin [uncultured Microbacterium sp.]